MQSTTAQKSYGEKLPFLFLSGWALLLLAHFVPALPQPAVVIGYLWKVEFALAFLLLVTLVLFARFAKDKIVDISRGEMFSIVAPLALFTAWSGLSYFWAASPRDAVHHTLLWACYFIFYLLMRRAFDQPGFRVLSFKWTALAVFILGAACLAEYASNYQHINAVFTFRYYKFAEAALTLLPVFLALALKAKRRGAFLFGSVAVLAWLVMLLCMSRTLFIAGFVSTGAFFVLAFLIQDRKRYLKRALILIGVFAVCVVLTQIPIFSPPEKTTAGRFASGDGAQASFNSRFLFWGIAFAAFKQNPLSGTGADNFAAAYGTARASYSTLNKENQLLEINENVLAERVHNEYLQILSELGLVGAALFAWLLGGIAWLFFSIRKKRVSLLSIAVFAGMSAFLIGSMASSYSFRVPANGLCFFFLLALATRSLKSKVQCPKPGRGFNFRHWTQDFGLAAGAFVCVAMLIFSGVRGASLMYLQFALTETNESEKEKYFDRAIELDGTDALIRISYGSELYAQRRTEEAIPQIRLAIDRGIAISVAYFDLAAAQTVAGKPLEAEQTFAEAIKVYPRSVFLRTSYAAFLASRGRADEAEREYAKANEINPRQAASWRLAHTEGIKKLSAAEYRNASFVEQPMDLSPTEGIYALLDFQRQFNPNLVRR